MNTLTHDPAALTPDTLPQEVHTLESRRLLNEFHRALDSGKASEEAQLGNVGGEPYWSWYGFQGRVEWCACFVSCVRKS